MPRGGGENLSYPVDKSEDSIANNKATSCCGLRSSLAVPLSKKSILHTTHSSPPYSTANAVPTQNKNVILRAAEQPRSTHSLPQHSTAHAAPQTNNTVATATQALDRLERKLEQRLRVAATNFANNTAQGFVQQSLPQRLLGGHWLREKFQFLSTLAWQSGDDKGGILGELDLVIPLYGKRNAAGADQYGFFLQPGLVSWEADNGDRRLDVNVGLAYRQRVRERIAVGAAVFYDHNIDSDLKRIAAAADVVSPYTYLAVNYYEPLSGWRSSERLGYEERALRGVDVNVEQALWDSHWILEASGGYWKGYDADNRQGEWQLAGSMGIRFYPLDYLSVYADYAYHHEDVDTDRFAAGIEFSYPGKHRSVSENEIDLWRPVKREKRILYAERKKVVAPTLTLVTNPTAVTAGNMISLLVTSDRAVSGTLTLSLAISGQVMASDFTNGLMQSVSANFNGGTTAMVMIATRNFGGTAKTYMITLGSGTGYIVGSDSTAMGAINADTATLTLATAPVDTAGGGAISLVVTSDIPVAGTLTLPLTISGQVLAGDFTGGLMQSVNANFNGSTTATVTIATVKDADAVETYTITLGSSDGYMVGGDSTAAGRIMMALPILTLATDPSAVDPGNAISLVITSDIPVAGMLTLPLTISDRASSGLVAGYFTGGLNQSVSASFGGRTTATVTIATVRLGGTARTYTITLGSGAGYTLGRDRTAEGTINVLLSTLTLVNRPADVRSGEDISLVITSDIPVAGTLTVALMIGGQGSFSVDAADFTNGFSQSLNADFNGSTTATVMIGTVNDGDLSEDYRITLGSGSNYRVGSRVLTVGSILQR